MAFFSRCCLNSDYALFTALKLDSLVCSFPLRIKWLLQNNAIVHNDESAQVNKAGIKSSTLLDFQFQHFF